MNKPNLENKLNQVEPQPSAQIIQMAGGHYVAKAIFAAAELGIADHIEDEPVSAEELAQATETNSSALYRLLRTMSGLGFFTEDKEKRFSLTSLGKALKSDAPGYARSTVRAMAGPTFWNAWGEFLYSVKTGKTAAEHVFGKSIFEHLAEKPEQAKLFNEMMIGFHGEEPPAIAEGYDFSEIKTIVDVGGGTGNLLTTILQAYPEMQGILFDLPHVAEEAQDLIETKNLSANCTIVSGSFFDSVPKGGDVYILSHIIHDWSEEQCLQILENCRSAMSADARLLVIEMVIPPGNDFHPAKLLDLQMLTVAGGQERTKEEYAELLGRSGFDLVKIIPTKSPVSVIEAQIK